MYPIHALRALLALTAAVVLLPGQAVCAADDPLSAYSYDPLTDLLALEVSAQPLAPVLQALAQRLGFELKGAIPQRSVSLSVSGPAADVLKKLVAPGGVIITHRDGVAAGRQVISRVWVLDEGQQGRHLPTGALAEAHEGGKAWRQSRRHMSSEERSTTHVGKKKTAAVSSADTAGDPAASGN